MRSSTLSDELRCTKEELTPFAEGTDGQGPWYASTGDGKDEGAISSAFTGTIGLLEFDGTMGRIIGLAAKIDEDVIMRLRLSAIVF